MKGKKWLILCLVLALIAGTAGVLRWLKTNQKLGTPGIKVTPIPGSVAVNIKLPERVLDFTSTNVPESEMELNYFPKDTSYVHRHYQAPDGFNARAIVILMGADRTSIHRPEYCLVGQGWAPCEKTAVNIPIVDRKPYSLPVMKWIIRNSMQTSDGQNQELHAVYVFWYVANGEQTTSNVKLQCYLIRDLLFTGILQRWAYVSYLSFCAPGQEEATFERMKQLIAASVPEFQLPPKEKQMAAGTKQ
jgi:hypothetical protein